MKIHELKDSYGLTLKLISEKTGIPYSRVCKLNKQEAIYNMTDYELIRKYVENIGKNIIQVDFTPNTDKRAPFSWERRGEIDLNDYRRKKESVGRTRRKENISGKVFKELRRRQENGETADANEVFREIRRQQMQE